MKKNYDIKKLREKKGYNIKDFAQIVGVPKDNLCRIECYKAVPGPKVAERLANYFNLDVEGLRKYYKKNLKPFHNGKFIHDKRVELDIDPQRLMELLNITKAAYYRLEAGTMGLSVKNTRLLAMAFDMPLTAFCESILIKEKEK